MPSDHSHTEQLIHEQLRLTTEKFYEKIRPFAPGFVAREEIYTPRVIASFGQLDTALTLLYSVVDPEKLSAHADQFTKADAFRTLGFTKYEAGCYEEALMWLSNAINIFYQSGNSNTENAVYTYLSLSLVFRATGDVAACERSLQAALDLWETNEHVRDNRQCGIKVVRDLEQIYCDQDKHSNAYSLRMRYPNFFEQTIIK